jgi:hypothetical protein
MRNGFCTVVKPLFVYSFGVVEFLLNINSLKFAVAA